MKGKKTKHQVNLKKLQKQKPYQKKKGDNKTWIQ